MTEPIDEYYESMAPGYDALHGQEQLEKLKLVLHFLEMDSELDLKSTDIVFDVGCGTGLAATIISCKYTGLDPAIGLLRIANDQRKIKFQNEVQISNAQKPGQFLSKNLGYIRGIAEALPIKSKKCSIVISVTAVHNFEDIDRGILELKRITGTRAIITVLKKSNNFHDIIKIIKRNFEVLKTNENNFDYFLYLKPKEE